MSYAQAGMFFQIVFLLGLNSRTQDPLRQTPNSSPEADGLVEPETQSAASHGIQPQPDTAVEALSSLCLVEGGEAWKREEPKLSHAPSQQKSLCLLRSCSPFTNPQPCTKGKRSNYTITLILKVAPMKDRGGGLYKRLPLKWKSWCYVLDTVLPSRKKKKKKENCI